MPPLDHVVPKGRDGRSAHRHGVIGKPAAQNLGKPLALPFDSIVPHCLQAFLDFPQLDLHSLPDWLPPKHEAVAIPSGCAVMREPKEVERLRLAETQRTPARNSTPSKLDEPRFVGMKGQSKARKPHFEIGKELLRLMLVLKAVSSA